MPLTIVTIPCLSDNYAFLIHDPDSGETALVDVPEAQPILDELTRRNWSLTHILITHHHWDHVDGLAELQQHTDAKVYGSKADMDRLPPLHVALDDGDTVNVGKHTAKVIDVSGHTINHIAYLFDGHIFTADSLMALGCGRVFESTKPQMWASLQKFLDLPDDTIVYSGHEYTASNAKFALSVDPNNQALIERANMISRMRTKGEATVPSPLGLEKATNPFLRAHEPSLKRALDMEHASDAEVFTEIRTRKDNF